VVGMLPRHKARGRGQGGASGTAEESIAGLMNYDYDTPSAVTVHTATIGSRVSLWYGWYTTWDQRWWKTC